MPKQSPTMTLSLKIFADGHSPKPGHRSTNVYPDYANNDAFVEKDERMIAWFRIVGMIFDVGLKLATILEKHLAASVMERTPLFAIAWRSEFVVDSLHNFTDSYHMIIQVIIQAVT